ncbi:unnamed protein product, partial [Mesorhabditis spiculigera]
MDAPLLTCGPDELILAANSKAPFEGQVFVRGHHRKPDCAHIFSNSENTTTEPSLAIPLSRISSCGLDFERNSETKSVTLRATIVFAFHPMFVTAADRIFSVVCAFQQRDFTVQAQLDSVNDFSSTIVVGATALPPSIHLSISGQALSVGDPLLFTWALEEHYQVYGMRVISCDATTSDGLKSSRLLEAGCSLDETLIGQIRYSEDDSQAFADGLAFKFADEDEVWIKCQVQLCIHQFEHLLLGATDNANICQEPVDCKKRTKRSTEDDIPIDEDSLITVSQKFMIGDPKVLPAQALGPTPKKSYCLGPTALLISSSLIFLVAIALVYISSSTVIRSLRQKSYDFNC